MPAIKRGIINSTRPTRSAARAIIFTPFPDPRTEREKERRGRGGRSEREREGWDGKGKKGGKTGTDDFWPGLYPPLGDNVVSHVLWSVPCAMVSDCVINRTRNGARVAGCSRARDTHDLRDFVCRNLAVASRRSLFSAVFFLFALFCVFSRALSRPARDKICSVNTRRDMAGLSEIC